MRPKIAPAVTVSYESPADARDYRKFKAALSLPLLMSLPSRLAISDNAISTLHPEAYLVKAAKQQAEIRAAAKPKEVYPDETIHKLIQLQDEDGQWSLGSAFSDALSGSFIPDRPEGTNAKMWATSLALTYLRRRPDLFEYSYEAYSKGFKWVESQDIVMSEAHKRLPPTDSEIYFPLDMNAVKEGRWAESTQKMLDIGGFECFTGTPSPVVAPIPRTPTPKNLVPARHDPPIIPKRELLAQQMQGLSRELQCAKNTSKSQFTVGESVECRWRKRGGRLSVPTVGRGDWFLATVLLMHEGGKMDVRFTDDGTRENRVAANHIRKYVEVDTSSSKSDIQGVTCPSSDTSRSIYIQSQAVNKIKDSWEDAPTLKSELRRLKTFAPTVRNHRPAFDTSTPAITFLQSKSLPLGQFTTSPNTDKQKKEVRRRPRQEVPAASAQQQPETETDELTNHAQVEAASISVIEALMAYDKCMEDVKKCLAASLVALKSATTYSQKVAALEQFRCMLGQGQPARPGYKDWRKDAVLGLQDVTLAAVEAIDEWSKASKSVPQGPFCWSGKPFLLNLPHHLDFLAEAGAKPVRQLYGDAFPVVLNPFSMCYSLNERPPTPTDPHVKAYIDGELKFTVSADLEKIRLQQAAVLEKVAAQQRACPSWLPGHGMEPRHFDRIRRAERILLNERQKFSRWQVNAPVSTKRSAGASRG